MMTDVRLLSQLARRNPVRWGGIEGFRLTRRALLAAGAAASAGAMLGRPAMAQERQLNLLTWDAYADPRLNELWQQQTQGSLKPEIHISDPQSVNRLRAGETRNFDFLNVNDPWARPYLWPEKLIVELPKDRFEPLYMQMKPKFHPPFKRCYSEDGEHLLGVVQRFETFDFVVNTDVISVDTAEKEGWSLFSNPDFAQRFGILAYDDWNVIDICMGAGVHPFRDKGDAEIARFTETANLWVNNAKMITTDFVQLNLGLLNGDIDLYFTGGTYSIAGARTEGNNNLYAITPLSGPADGKGGVNWIELNSAINNPNLHPRIFDFLEFITTPDAAYIVGSGNGNLQPVSQMQQEAVLAKFSKDELNAMQYDTLDHRIANAVEFDVVPQYDQLLDIYTAARRTRG
ncbi:MAG: spermidine/putrescine ABC transporter substrate-binding protein [Geminicoccaceae bacterium]